MSRVRRSDVGATAVEYALIISLIAVVILAAVVFLGDSVRGAFDDTDVALIGEVVDACPDLQGDQPEGSDCGDNALVDACPFEAGNQPAGTTCTVTDLCPNIAGLQTTGDLVGGQCPDMTPETYATWTRIGSSRNYHWTCANGFNLGSLGKPRRGPNPPAGAPPCQ